MERILEGNASAWKPSCYESMYVGEVEACAAQIATGTMPKLPNGFRVVFDPVVHDDPYFSGLIPAEQYTWHLAMRQMAIARPEAWRHGHDVAHIPGFRRMFGHEPYADLVQLAAFNSLGNLKYCKLFTEAHDSFADQMFYLYRDDGFYQMANIAKARRYLHTLIRLAYVNAGYSQEETYVRHKAKFDQLAALFELDQYEHWYETVAERVQVL